MINKFNGNGAMITVFGLLHIAEEENTSMNLLSENFSDQLKVYVNCAVLFSKMLNTHGIEFILITNRKSIIEEYLNSIDQHLVIQEIEFKTRVPHGVDFYSAHFKFDVFRYFASLPEGYYALCDIDMISINETPQCLMNIISSGIPLCYDISDQVIPAYGHDVIIRDLEKINNLKSEGRWYGGEFLSGPPGFFESLISVIDDVYDNYLADISNFHHVGDEIVTSACIEMLQRNGVHIADAGTLGIVGRYWNIDVLHPQKPYDYFSKCFLLHLPADKRLLAKLAIRDDIFLNNYLEKYFQQLKPLKSGNMRRLLQKFQFINSTKRGI